MERLTYTALEQGRYDGYLLRQAPERVLQFGEGNFLRGFAEHFIDVMNERTDVYKRQEGVYDLVFLMVKQTNNEASLRALLPHLGENSTVCTLQNGVPELAVAEFVGRNRTVGGACRWGATFVEPGISELTNALSARTVLFEIGEIDGRITDRIRAVAKVLGHMDNGKVEITDNLMGARWLKLMLNCCMSGLSSALGCTFESVISSEKALACTSYLAAEVVHAARAAGFQLTDTNGLNTAEIADFQTKEELERSKGYIYRNYYPLRTAKASMLQDLERGKKTEIQMINGYVGAMGRKYGVPTPFNDLVVKIITDIEEGRRRAEFGNLALFVLPELQ